VLQLFLNSTGSRHGEYANSTMVALEGFDIQGALPPAITSPRVSGLAPPFYR
jgi:hypothetical protein